MTAPATTRATGPDMLAAALKYAEKLEWPVVPLHTPQPDGTCSCRKAECVERNGVGKHPRTMNGLDDATTDPEQIRKWWGLWPDANIGVPTGADGSGLIVVDVDGPAGEEALTRYGPIPPTPTVLTGKGRHIYFAHPGDGREIRNSGGRGQRKLGDLLDSRGDGGYVVVPPSLHASGRRYRWDRENGQTPGEMRPQRLPEPILARLMAEDGGAPALDGEPQRAAEIPTLDEFKKGGRNETLTSYVGRLFKSGLEYREVLDLAWALNKTKGNPPMDRAEVEGIVHNIGKAESRKLGANARRAEGLLANGAGIDTRPVLPSGELLAAHQIKAAFETGRTDYSNALRWQWRDVDDLVGPLLPGELHLVGARTGQGKTTFLMNWMDYLVTKRGIPLLYIGMEMDAAQLRRKWAAWRCGLDAKLVLANQWHRLPDGAQQKIEDDLDWQGSADIMQLAHFSPARRIDIRDLTMWTKWAVDRGCRAVVVDHFHRMQHGGGEHERQSMSENVRVAKELAVEERVSMVMAAQVNRGSRDELDAYYPPPLNALKECGTLEEEADTVLMLHRALKEGGLPKGALAAVRAGERSVASVADPNTMGVSVRKCRRDGDAVDRHARLSIHGGIITDRQRSVTDELRRPEDRYGI